MIEKRCLAILISVLMIWQLGCMLPSPVFAQSPLDRATKEVDRLGREEQQRAEQKLMAPPRKPPSIKEETPVVKIEGPTFFIKKVQLEGVKAFPVETFKPFLEKYENREVSLGELKALAKEIEHDYLKRGVIAACFVPRQEIKEGVVILRVVEAKMGELTIKKHKYFRASRLKNYWTTKPGEVVRYDTLSRDLQLMNKNPDRRVKATLYAGAKPETTNVQLDTTTNFPIHVTATADREGAISTGRYRKGIGMVVNNFMGMDDSVFGGYTGGKNFGGVYAYHRIPITYFGTSVMYGYTKTKAFPKKDFEQFGLSSTSENLSVYLYQDLFHKDVYKGDISFGMDANNKRSVYNLGTINADRLRIARLGLSFVDRGFKDISYIKGEFSQGLNIFGARRKSEFSSRQAENTFSKGTLNASFRHVFPKNFQLYGKVSGQLASEKLMPQEEIYLGGIDSVRGYPSADYLGDSGFYANLELLVPAFFIPDSIKVPYGERPIKDEITGVAFFDYGYGTKRGNIQGELSKRRMASVGGGVRLRLLNQAMLRLEWGVPIDTIANLPLSEFARSRFHFSLDFQDDIPEEMIRLQAVSREENIKQMAWGILNSELKDPEAIFGRKVKYYLKTAEEAYRKGDLVKAREYYARLYNLGEVAYRQTETYIRDGYKQIEDLKKDNENANYYFDKGEIIKAREEWQKVREKAKVKELAIEINENKEKSNGREKI